MENRAERGMTLIELIVGLAISSVISLMAAQFFSAVAGLHRSTTLLSSIQKEGEASMSLLTKCFMNTEELFWCREGEGFVLILGRDGGGFEGQVFYYDGERLYGDLSFSDVRGKDTLFTAIYSRNESKRLSADEYLISNKVKELEISVRPEPSEGSRIGAHTYGVNGRLFIEARATMQYRESKDYEYGASALTRGDVDDISWIN